MIFILFMMICSFSFCWEMQEINKLAAYSKLVYKDNQSIFTNLPGSLIYDTAEHDIRWIYWKDPQTKIVYIIVRGSDNIENWLVNVQFDHDHGFGGLSIHSGFLKATNEVLIQLSPRIRKDLSQNPAQKFILCGHSLGGAIASLVGCWMHTNHIKFEKIITFGQPRVMDKKSAKKMQNLKILRVVNQLDSVTKVPAKRLDYLHFGRELVITPQGSTLSVSPLEDDGLDLETSVTFWAAVLEQSITHTSFIFKKLIQDHKMDNYLKILGFQRLYADEK